MKPGEMQGQPLRVVYPRYVAMAQRVIVAGGAAVVLMFRDREFRYQGRGH